MFITIRLLLGLFCHCLSPTFGESQMQNENVIRPTLFPLHANPYMLSLDLGSLKTSTSHRGQHQGQGQFRQKRRVDTGIGVETVGGVPSRSKDAPSMSTSCPRGHFACASSLHCIPQSANCNGTPECEDGSDELNCQDPHVRGEWDWVFVKRPDEDAEKLNGTCWYTLQPSGISGGVDFTLERKSHRNQSGQKGHILLSPIYSSGRGGARNFADLSKFRDDEVELVDNPKDSNSGDVWMDQGCLCTEEKLFCQNLRLNNLNFIPEDVTFLDLSGSRVENMDFSATPFPNLDTLVLSGCYVEEIFPGAFEQLKSLRVLYLTNNRLRYLAQGLFFTRGILQQDIGEGVAHEDDNETRSRSSIRRLFLDYNQISLLQSGAFQGLGGELVELNLRHNLITGQETDVFESLKGLKILHLNHNRIESIRLNLFTGLETLETLSLHNNAISYIELGAFQGLVSLKQLYLNWNKLRVLEGSVFCNLRNLGTLNLRGNEITIIERNAFSCLHSLTSLNLGENQFGEILNAGEIFQNLSSLEYIYFDNYWMCSWAPHVRSCEPKGDGISSITNLLDNIVLRVCVWIMGILSIVGNIFVIFCRMMIREPNRVHSFYIRNLAVADLLMGVFLLSIAVHDVAFRGQFLRYQYQWRHSSTCQFSGMLSTLSSEASVLILFLITLDRYLSIMRPFAEKNSSMNVAYTICGSLWAISCILAATPLLGGPFSGYFKGFYASNGLCIPLHIHNPYDAGWEYSFFLFVLINSVAFAFICFAYWRMFEVIRDSTMTTRNTQQKQDSILAKRFAIVVITDFLCWAPIVVAKVVGMSGVSIPSELNAWLAVFALPVNSALNPIIYTITTKLFQQQMGKLTRSFHSRLMSHRMRSPREESSSIFRYRTTRSGTGNTSLHSIRRSGTVNATSAPRNNLLLTPHLTVQAIPLKNLTPSKFTHDLCPTKTKSNPILTDSGGHPDLTTSCSTSMGNLCEIEVLGGEMSFQNLNSRHVNKILINSKDTKDVVEESEIL